MGIFKSDKSVGMGQDVPLEQVSAMKQQGYSNNQIIQTLQRDGYTSTQIFDAISQSELTTAQPTNTFGDMGSMGGMGSMNPQTQQLGQQLPPMQPMNMGGNMGGSMSGNMGGMNNMSSMPMQSMPMSGMQSSPEELIEAIIEEKWNELVKDINKVIEWKQKADTKLASMDQQLNDMQAQFDKLHQAVIGKVGDYDKHILEVGTQLQAMEKVFGKVLPAFIENVNELNIITQRIKVDRPDKIKRTNTKKGKNEEDE
jgi:hypothetical protein